MLHPVQGVLCVEGIQTGDSRIIAQGALTWADLPLPFACLTGDQHARGESEQVGTVDTITRDGNRVLFTGFVDDQIEQGAEMIRQMQAGSAPLGARFGVSIDPDDWEVELVDTDPSEGDELMILMASGHGVIPTGRLALLVAAAGEGDPGGEVLMEDAADKLIERYTRLRIRGATACSVAAFAEAYVELAPAVVDSGTADGAASGTATTSAVTVTIATGGDTLPFAVHEPFTGIHAHPHSAMGSQGGDETHEHSHSHSDDAIHDHDHSQTASGGCEDCDDMLTAAGGPLLPPADWFRNPNFQAGDGRLVRQPDGSYACPLTVLDDGRVFGHMAGWSSCHTGILDRCVTPPRSPSGYAYFNDGPLPTAEGETVHVGQLTMGAGHPDERPGRVLNWRQAKDHYDGGPGAVQMADVVVGEDQFGIWFAGALRPGLTDEQIRAFKACGVSGDWREIVRGKGLDLVACAAGVVSEGFQMARLAASADLELAGCLPSTPFVHIEDGRPVALVASGVVRQPLPWERALGGLHAELVDVKVRLARAENVTDALRQEAAQKYLAAAGVTVEVAADGPKEKELEATLAAVDSLKSNGNLA